MNVSALGVIVNGALVVALVFVAAIFGGKPVAMVLAIVTAGLAFVSYNLRFCGETEALAPLWSLIAADWLAILSILTILAAFAALFF